MKYSLSTTLSDALLLGSHMMDIFARLGAVAVCVTFIDELALHGEEAVSMMSTVRDDDPAIRTYKVIRKLPRRPCLCHVHHRQTRSDIWAALQEVTEMKANLMYRDYDFDLKAEPCFGKETLIADLELSSIILTMAQDDKTIKEVCITALFDPLQKAGRYAAPGYTAGLYQQPCYCEKTL